MKYIFFGNLAFNNQNYIKSLWFYTKAIQENPNLKNSIEYNVKITKKKLQNDFIDFDVDIIIPVYNALSDLKICLESLKKFTLDSNVRIFLVNDGSEQESTEYLRKCFVKEENIYLLEHPENLGYTQAVNTGLKASEAAYVVLLNSDTVVTQGWLDKMLTCMNSSKKIDIVGPLSNAASYQSVPEHIDKDGKYMVNDLPKGYSVDDMAQLVENIAFKSYPKVNFVNGFCFMIKREVIDTIGYMDQENFPVGYGEETDYCIRAQDAGFELAIADDVYIYHAKSKSFGHEKRKLLSRRGTQSLKSKHTAEKYFELVQQMKLNEDLEVVRQNIRDGLNLKLQKGDIEE